MKPILTILKFCWKALNFIRDLVMNFVFSSVCSITGDGFYLGVKSAKTSGTGW